MQINTFLSKANYAIFFFVFLQQAICGKENLIDWSHTSVIHNQDTYYTLLNSVDFHPTQNIFCVTYSNINKIILYKIDSAGKPKKIQTLNGSVAELLSPQHAVFSSDGTKIVVANWGNQALNVYQKTQGQLYQEKPVANIQPHPSLKNHRPHGMAFSPCGNYLAIAFGAADYYDKAIALYSVVDHGLNFELLHLLQAPNELPGTPKGITFTPDANCLLVTFCDTNSLVIYNLSKKKNKILQKPKQVIQGDETGIFRPEDVKITPDGKYCVLSNSEHHTVTFYPFDKTHNRITQTIPVKILENPEYQLQFPHGIAFSSDGKFMVITEFGEIKITTEGDIVWDHTTSPKEAKFHLYSNQLKAGKFIVSLMTKGP